MGKQVCFGIVEDESLVSEDLKSQLERFGYSVQFRVASGEDCLATLEDCDVDIVIMDIELPGDLNGIETAEKLQKHKIPVVYVTGSLDDDTLERANKTNPLGYLSKPFSETSLKTTIAEAVRKQKMEEELRRSERRYRELVETTPDIVFRVDRNQQFTFISKNVRQLGYNHRELIGTQFTEILHPDHAEAVARKEVLPKYEGGKTGDDLAPDLFDERRTGERSTRNLEVKLRVGSEDAREKYGTEYPTFEVNSAGLFRDGEPEQASQFVGSVGTMRDVTRRKEANKELRLKDRAMSSAQEGITIAEVNGGNNPLIYVNEGFVEMTGYERAWALGRDCRFLQGEGTQEHKIDKMRKAIENREPVTVEVINYRKNGDPFWNQVSITPIRNQEGEVTHFVGIQQDVTEKKEQEEELRQAEKLAAIGEMAAGLMHEINNPNAFIQGNINYLEKAWDQLVDALPSSVQTDETISSILDELEGTLDDMLRGTQRIEEIVNNVKLFARREKRNPDKQKIDPVNVVQDALTTLEVIDEDWVQLDLDIDSDRCLEADPTELSQVVTNLVNNAADATENLDEPRVAVETHFESEYFRLIVEDNGHGIPEELRSQVFDPFFTTKPTGEGTGLGLSIVKGIVDRMGGEIDLETSEDAGTRFSVKLPLES